MSKQKIYNFTKGLLDTPYSIQGAIFTLLAIILVRLGIENWIAHFIPEYPSFYFYEFLHTTSFFFLLFILCVFLLKKIATISQKTSITILLFGFIMIIFPPIFDWIISTLYFDGAHFTSYYLFDSPTGLSKSFVTFFGDKPRDGITYGTRIMIVFTLFFFGLITWLKTKKITRTLLIVVITYILFFLLSSAPSLLTYTTSTQHFTVTRADVAGFIASPTAILGNQISDPPSAINRKMSLIYIFLSIIIVFILLYKIYRPTFIALVKNIRPVQTIYHIGLLIVGINIAIIFADTILLSSVFSIVAFFLLSIAIIFAWYSTVIFNDCVDQKIDIISNPTRPLITGIINITAYKKIGLVFAILSIIITAAISGYAAIVLIVYHSLSFLYNTPPLRLKKFPLIATLIASLASFFIVVIGFITVAPTHSLNNFPPHIAILLIIAYTISLPIKDLKDIAGDKKNYIYTIPVIFGERIGRIIIATGIFISFMLSIFTLGTKTLLIPAILAGTLSFWTLVGRKNNKFIFLPKQIIGVIFLIVSLYSIILAISLLK